MEAPKVALLSVPHLSLSFNSGDLISTWSSGVPSTWGEGHPGNGRLSYKHHCPSQGAHFYHSPPVCWGLGLRFDVSTPGRKGSGLFQSIPCLPLKQTHQGSVIAGNFPLSGMWPFALPLGSGNGQHPRVL